MRTASPDHLIRPLLWFVLSRSLHVKALEFAAFVVRVWENTTYLINPNVKKNRTRFACEDVGLCPFYGSTVKGCNLFTRTLCSIGFLRNHLLSENMQWNYAPFKVTLNYLMHKTMEFCVTSSLALDNWEQKYCQTLGSKPNDSHRVLRRRLFSKGKNLNYAIVCFTQCTLLFQKVCFLLQICLPSVIYGTYVTKINAVLWHSARLTFASLGLFTFARIACLLQLWTGRRSDDKRKTDCGVEC